MLDSYALKNTKDFEFGLVNKNINDFDIIFGEYHELSKLTKFNYEYPNELKEFYSNNSIELKNNIFPLDLDTFIIINNSNLKKVNFKKLSNFQDTKKYSLGMSFAPREIFTNFIIYNLGKDIINFNDNSTESFLSAFKKMYRYKNKNILRGNYQEIYESYENNENAFTLFSDGILLYDDFKYENFQLFPKNSYKWDVGSGKFIQSSDETPISFFGFSAYLNNSNHDGFLCYLTQKHSRHYGFSKFNIQLSPLSSYELNNFPKKISNEYMNILQNKNKFIINSQHSKNNKSYDLIINYLRDKILYKDIINQEGYLN